MQKKWKFGQSFSKNKKSGRASAVLKPMGAKILERRRRGLPTDQLSVPLHELFAWNHRRAFLMPLGRLSDGLVWLSPGARRVWVRGPRELLGIILQWYKQARIECRNAGLIMGRFPEREFGRVKKGQKRLPTVMEAKKNKNWNKDRVKEGKNRNIG